MSILSCKNKRTKHAINVVHTFAFVTVTLFSICTLGFFLPPGYNQSSDEMMYLTVKFNR